MMKQIGLLIVLLSISGCMDVVSSSSQQISIDHSAFDRKRAFVTAQQHCYSHGKNALRTSEMGLLRTQSSYTCK